jgi:group I intron endonuclease
MRKRDYTVYLHINKVNKKVYVGITSMRVENRWSNFEHIILCKTSKDRAIILEKSLIKFYKNRRISYNISSGGEDAGTVSEYTKEKLRQYKGEKSSMFGKHPSKEKRISTRKALGHYSKDTSWLAPYRLRKGKESPMYGRKPSENTLLAHRKVILQFSLDGEFIKEFSSIKEASGEIGIFKPAIVHCLKGKTKKAGGYKWKYKYE